MVDLTPTVIEHRFFPIWLKRISDTFARQQKAIALLLTVTAWGLMWAQALALVEIVAQWLCVLGFFAGIVLGCGAIQAQSAREL